MGLKLKQELMVSSRHNKLKPEFIPPGLGMDSPWSLNGKMNYLSVRRRRRALSSIYGFIVLYTLIVVGLGDAEKKKEGQNVRSYIAVPS